MSNVLCISSGLPNIPEGYVSPPNILEFFHRCGTWLFILGRDLAFGYCKQHTGTEQRESVRTEIYLKRICEIPSY